MSIKKNQYRATEKGGKALAMSDLNVLNSIENNVIRMPGIVSAAEIQGSKIYAKIHRVGTIKEDDFNYFHASMDYMQNLSEAEVGFEDLNPGEYLVPIRTDTGIYPLTNIDEIIGAEVTVYVREGVPQYAELSPVMDSARVVDMNLWAKMRFLLGNFKHDEKGFVQLLQEHGYTQKVAEQLFIDGEDPANLLNKPIQPIGEVMCYMTHDGKEPDSDAALIYSNYVKRIKKKQACYRPNLVFTAK